MSVKTMRQPSHHDNRISTTLSNRNQQHITIYNVNLKESTERMKGFDLAHPDNYDLNVILILSNYFNKVSLEYFSRILHNYATDLLQATNIPEPEKHYYYRSCMNIYGACLYKMLSPRAQLELINYIKAKKKFLNANTKFEIFLNKKRTLSGVKSRSSNSSLKLSSTALQNQASKKNPKNMNGVSKLLQEKITLSEPNFNNFKALKYQSHVLGNIQEANILDYLFINYINTPRFHANLNFVSHCFKSSFDKAEALIKNKKSCETQKGRSQTPISEQSKSATTSPHTSSSTSHYDQFSNSDGDDLAESTQPHRRGHLKKRNIAAGKVLKFSKLPPHREQKNLYKKQERGGKISTILQNSNLTNTAKSEMQEFQQTTSITATPAAAPANEKPDAGTDISSIDSTHSELLH